MSVSDLQANLTQPLVDDGASAAATAVEAVAGADFVISMLPSGAIVESLYVHDTKLLDHIAKDCLVIDCSTVAPEIHARLRALPRRKIFA